MNLPPPPPMLPGPLTSGLQQSINNEKISCSERKQMTHDEAKRQIEQLCTLELNEISNLSAAEEGPKGMLVIMTPILEPLLQSGPVCGLIALVEAAQILGINLVPDFILNEAIRLGFTKNGEMFSVKAMQSLVTEYLKCDGRILDTTKVENTCQELLLNLLNGYPALIPYDADHNHSPAMRKGHAAHWAVIHGFALLLPCSKITEITGIIDENKIVIIDSEKVSSSFHDIMTNLIETILEDAIYLISHQGKSVRPAVWKYYKLISSNQNLHEVSPKLVSSSEEEYILGDIKSELCSQLLLLFKK